MQITQRQAELCGCLADLNRILILYALADKSHNVSELVARLGISQPTISRHLKILRNGGIVCAHRDGKAVCYELADRRILEALNLLRAFVTEEMKKQGQVANTATERPVI